MRTSEIQEKLVAQLGITIDDYYADPSLAVARDIFRSLTRCGPSDEEVEAFLHAQKPFCHAESTKAYWEEKLAALENKNEANAYQLKQWAEELIVLSSKESEARDVWHKLYEEVSGINIKRNKLANELKVLKADENNPAPVGQLADMEKELETYNAEILEKSKINNEQFTVFQAFTKDIKTLQAKVKELKNTPNAFQQEINTMKDKINRLPPSTSDYYQKDDDALDFLFAILLGVRLNKKDYFNTYPSLPIPLTPSEKMVAVAKHMKRNNLQPKDWRQQLHRLCSLPLKRHSGTISNPTEESKSFFEMKRSSLSATDISAFLALKLAALQHEYILSGTGAIILALPGGLAATINIREKGRVIAKHQKSKVETYINLLKANSQYAYHLMYHYGSGAVEGISIETPGAYYILAETYVFEISFMAAPMLLGSGILSKPPQLISQEQAAIPGLPLPQTDWDDED